jgi:Xaa-Pro dipeptidase
MSGHDFAAIREQLDHNPYFATMRNTPYYADAVYPRFSAAETARRYDLTREKMARLGLDCLVVGGAPNHWSYGSGVTWLSGHREWHCIAVYMVVPLEGEPTLIYSMGGTHAEATRRAVTVNDVRQSRLGRFAEVIAERVTELGLAQGRVGVTAVDPHYMDYMPVNQWRTLRERLPEATLERVGDFFHEFLAFKSPEEQEYVRRAGELCGLAMEAMLAATRPGATEYQLKAAAAAAIYEGGGEVDFLIIGSSPMAEPGIIFGNPRPSRRALQQGDIVVNELAASYEGYSAQIGVPICVGEPTAQVREMFDEIVLPGYKLMEQHLRPGGTLQAIWEASRFFREHGYQSRPVQLHGIDLVSQSPHIYAEEIKAHAYEQEIKPGMELMLEPNPITLDGRLGLFLGHTYLITASGHERVTSRVPLELLVAEA